VSCLRENLTSSSYGEGLETGRDSSVPRQSFTRQVNFRDEKTLLGVGDAQVRGPQAVQNVTATAVAAYALLLAAAQGINRAKPAEFALPRPKWQRKQPHRATTQSLIQQMRFELWGHTMSFSHFASKRPATPSAENSLHNPSHAVLYASRHS